jgi:hypothetical protein
LVPGHEIVGRVSALGEGVTSFELGERVGIPWLGHTCGSCRYCLSGRENGHQSRKLFQIRAHHEGALQPWWSCRKAMPIRKTWPLQLGGRLHRNFVRWSSVDATIHSATDLDQFPYRPLLLVRDHLAVQSMVQNAPFESGVPDGKPCHPSSRRMETPQPC